MKLRFKIPLLITSLLCFIAGIILKNPYVLLTSVLLILSHNVLLSMDDFYKNAIFFCFNITFFVFLVSRMVVTGVFGYKESTSGLLGLNFKEPVIINTVIVCLYISLIAVFIGYKIIQKANLNFLNNKKNPSNSFLNSLRISSLIYFGLFLVIRFVYAYELIQAVVSGGFYETFLSHNSSLPRFLVKFSETYEVAFYTYLATMPSKRKSVLPIFLFILEGFLMALAGRRSNFVLNILIIFIYFCIRSLPKEKGNKWLGKFELGLGLSSIPLLMGLMTIIGYLRAGVNRSLGFINSVLDFFYSQGVSANVIGYAKIYESKIPDNIYTFGPIFEFIHSRITRPLRGMPGFVGQTRERALNGFLFSHAISYIIMPDLYLKGHGYGSSFVAELFYDFSYIGVFAGSIVYGAIIYIFYYTICNSNYIFVIFSMLMTKSILFAPRAAFLSIIVDAFTPRNIIAVIIIILMAKLLHFILKQNTPSCLINNMCVKYLTKIVKKNR